MSDEQNLPHDATTPPMNPVEEVALDVQGWPKPIGITSIVLGAFNLTCLGCGAAGLGAQVMFFEQMKQQYPDGMPPSMASVSIPMVASMIFGGLVNVLLIGAGATLLMRRGEARMLHLVYALLAFVSFVVSTVVQVQYQVDLTEWVKQNPDTAFSKQQQATGWIGQAIGWTLGIVLGFLWPAFCLVWFGFVKKSSDITQGSQDVI